jgi:hypothetical protein
MGIGFEREVDRLYGVDPDRFVDKRTAIARALREEGRRTEARASGPCVAARRADGGGAPSAARPASPTRRARAAPRVRSGNP